VLLEVGGHREDGDDAVPDRLLEAQSQHLVEPGREIGKVG
jgi:hypothetical protein